MRPTAPPNPPPMAWCLRFQNGALRGRTIALKHGSNVLGSGADCDVMLPGGEVEPRHLQLTVGELLVSAQTLGASPAQLNGEEMSAQRRSVLAGDVLSDGGIAFQLDQVQSPAAQPQAPDSMFAGDEELPPVQAQPAASTHRGRWIGGGAVVAVLVGALALAPWEASGRRTLPESVDLQALQRLLAGYPEVEAVAAPGGAVALRG